MLTVPTPAIRAMLAVRPPALPVPAELLMTNRVNPMGYAGYPGSNGTDTDSNFRLQVFNETGADVTRVRLVFQNWMANATNEQDAFNPITVTASVEYPAGSFTQVTFSGSPSAVIANGGLLESDEITLATPIPADTKFWTRTYVSVTAGQKWPQGYLTNAFGANFTEAADFSTGVDKTMGGTITNATATANRRGYGPSLIRATGFSGTPRKLAWASVGDSILMAASDGNFDTRGSTGWNGRAFSGRFPHLNLAVSGTSAQLNQPANFTRRLALLRKSGITHVLCDFGSNDLPAGRTLTQMQADLTAIWTMLNDAGFKVVQTTMTPRTTARFFNAASLTASGTTVTVSAPAHGLVTGQIVKVSGASPTTYNNTFPGVAVTVVDADTFTYTAASTPASSPATGTIKIDTAFETTADQTIITAGSGNFVGSPGAVGSVRAQLNDWIRTKPAPLWDWFEMADAVETARNSGIWAVNNTWQQPAFTTDGIHPLVTRTNPEEGAHFVLRDALIARLAAFAAG